MEGTPFGRYRLLESLSQDQQSQTWRSYDTVSGRYGAVRIFAPERSADQEFSRQFYAAAKSSEAVARHPGVVPVGGAGEIDGRLYVETPLMAGRSLAQILQSGPVTQAQAVGIVAQIAPTLTALHQAGGAHGAVNVSNVVVSEQNQALLTGFVGNGPADAAADVAGLAQVLRDSVAGPGGHSAGPSLDAVIARGTSDDPWQRYGTADELAAAARAAITTGQPGPAPSAAWAPPPGQYPPNQYPQGQYPQGQYPSGPWHPQQQPPPSRRTTPLVIAGVTSVVVLLVVGLVVTLLLTRDSDSADASSTDETSSSSESSDASQSGLVGDAIRVVSPDVVLAESGEPAVVLSLYEDYLCPHCQTFENTYGDTIEGLMEDGSVAVDYYPVAILDTIGDGYSSRAGGAAFCVAAESIDAFRRFHAGLFAQQPAEMAGTSFPSEDDLVELARQAGAAEPETVDCIENGDYVEHVQDMVNVTGINSTPTVRINGDDFELSTPDELVDEVEAQLR